MKPMHIAMALLSAAMFFVLAGVFMGVQLELDGTKLVVDSASDVRWQWVFIGTAVVFFFQLLRPAFQKGLKSVSGPKFILPAIDGSTVKQKLFLVALLVLAVAVYVALVECAAPPFALVGGLTAGFAVALATFAATSRSATRR